MLTASLVVWNWNVHVADPPAIKLKKKHLSEVAHSSECSWTLCRLFRSMLISMQISSRNSGKSLTNGHCSAVSSFANSC